MEKILFASIQMSLFSMTLSNAVLFSKICLQFRMVKCTYSSRKQIFNLKHSAIRQNKYFRIYVHIYSFGIYLEYRMTFALNIEHEMTWGLEIKENYTKLKGEANA